MTTAMPDPRCPECGAPLTPGAAQGLCAHCLLAGAAAPTEHGAPRSAPPTLEQVTAAFPQFEVIELIGRGGMGAVYKVRQPKLDRFAALKLLPESLGADPAFATRFEREARLLARLNHANIVSVYEFGHAALNSQLSTKNIPSYYLLMEFVDGVNLRQAMRASRFTPAQALGIVPKICDALQFAHDEGVLHRDIKPENILLDAKGRVKLADFGIAKLIGDGTHESHGTDSSHDSHLTQSGSTLGTPSYMAPEQRDTPADVDHRADIYSLGVVFYELLTGELPRGSFVQPSAKSDADPRVDAIVQQALEKERDRRQHSAGEVKTQVEAMATGTKPPPLDPIPAVNPSPTPAPPPFPPMKTHVKIVAILHIAFGLMALLGAIAVFLFLGLAGGIVISQGENQAAGILGIVAFFLTSFLAILALPGIIGGWGLFAGRRWAHPFVLVLGVLHLINIPFGTALGVYTLWALLKDPPSGPETPPATPGAIPRTSAPESVKSTNSKFPRAIIVGIILLFLLVTGLPIADRLLPQVYFSRVTMELRPDNTGSHSQENAGYRQTIDPQFIAVQRLVLRKKEILTPVVEKLRLETIWAKNGQSLSMEETLARLSDSLEFREVRNTSLFEIGSLGNDPVEAADVANTLAVVYRQRRLLDLQKNLDVGLEAIRQEVEKYLKQADEAFVEMAKIRVQYHIIDPDPNNYGSGVQTLPDGLNFDADGKAKEGFGNYVEAKTRALQTKRIYEGAQSKYSAELLKRGIDFDPVKIWETAVPSTVPLRFNFRRLRYAFNR